MSDSESSCSSDSSVSEQEFSAPAKTLSKETMGTASDSDDDSSSAGESFASSSEDPADSSDDDSSDESSSSSEEEKWSSDDSDDDSSDDDDDSDDEAEKAAPKLGLKRTASMEPPPGISEEAYKTFFTQPVEEEEEEKKQSEPTRGISRKKSAIEVATENMIAETNRQMEKRQISQHSVESCEKMLEELSKDLEEDFCEGMDTFKNVDDISIEEEAKKPREPQRGTSRQRSNMLRDKREMRLAKVRDRLRKKEEEKEEKETEEKELELVRSLSGTGNLDMSEDARRERCYSWYTRMAMPSKKEMQERVETMPASSGISVEDIDLLPWNARGSMVNVGKMQRFINAGFKKKFARKSSTTDDNSDSD